MSTVQNLDDSRDTSWPNSRFSRSVLSFPCNVACRSTKRLQAAQKASYEVPSPVHIKHPHAMVPNMWLHPRHFTMVSGGCLNIRYKGEGIISICVCKKRQKQPLLFIFVPLQTLSRLEMVQRKPWTKPWKNLLFRRPTNLGALADVFGKPLGSFLPHQVVVLESPLELFSLFRLAMKTTRTRSLDPWWV